MGTVEGDETSSDVDSYDAATQQIDSQFSPGGAVEGCEDDDFLNITNTMPIHDTYILEDEFETQMANLDEETQMVDLGKMNFEGEIQHLDEETQMVDLGEMNFEGETQMLDLYEETQVVDLPGETQVLDEFNAELIVAESRQTNKADVMFETQRISEEGSVKIDDSVSGEFESTADKDPPKEEPSPGGFTSIRTASIRASGLAAQSRGATCGLSTTSTDKSSLEQQTDASSKFGSERISNKHKIGSKAARRLFEENQDAQVHYSETEIIQTDNYLNIPELLAAEDSVAGLSYVESQEPGELSQAHALEVVDRFLDLSFLKHDEGFDKKVQNIEKTKAVSAAKGSLDLAKKSNLQDTVGGGGIYDWDNAREDDCGGEFLVRKRELFFDKEGPKRRCLTEPRKSKSVKDSEIKEKQCTKPKLGYLMYSASGLLHRQRSKKKSHCGEEALEKNIIENLEERLHEVSGPELSDNGADEDIPDMRNIGPDTQMAAEAMGDLCFEANLDAGNNSADRGLSSTGTAARKNKLRDRTVHSEEYLPYSTSAGVVTRHAKRTKRITTGNSSESSRPLNQHRITKKGDDRVLVEAEGTKPAAENASTHLRVELTGQKSEKSYREDNLGFYVPVAHRTRKSAKLNCPKGPANLVDARCVTNDMASASACRKKTAARDKNSVTMTIEEIKKVGLARLKQSNETRLNKLGASDIKAAGNLQVKRSSKEALAVTRYSERLTRSSAVPASIPINSDKDRLNHPSPCLGLESRKIISKKTANARNSLLDDVVGTSTSKQGDDKNYDEACAEGAERNGRQEATARCGPSFVNCATPATRSTLRQDASPICMGDEYRKQSCRKNLSTASLIREINDLRTDSPKPCGGMRESRKRKDITAVRVLFSQHLDDDVVKHQKKILARLGSAVASSMLDATHFIADEFVRTRNMLEAIASGKPVVTRLWIESCGQASCLIDEKNYILRDAKKEKEFGFCLPVSLARASQRPLLQGQKVFVTPNTKPGKDILINLIKAVHGLPLERLGRSVFKDEKLPDDLLVLSCEEDYDACVPFLERGGAIYSSELLLNGIVKQKLEFERHGLFADNVKRTRSRIWLSKTNKSCPVTK